MDGSQKIQKGWRHSTYIWFCYGCFFFFREWGWYAIFSESLKRIWKCIDAVKDRFRPSFWSDRKYYCRVFFFLRTSIYHLYVHHLQRHTLCIFLFFFSPISSSIYSHTHSIIFFFICCFGAFRYYSIANEMYSRFTSFFYIDIHAESRSSFSKKNKKKIEAKVTSDSIFTKWKCFISLRNRNSQSLSICCYIFILFYCIIYHMKEIVSYKRL